MTLWQKIKEIARKMLPKKSIEEILHVTPCVSDRMANAIQMWSDMYEGKAPWLHLPEFKDPTRVVSLGLPAFIASEKARMATLEMKSEITTPMKEDDSKKPGTDNTVSSSLNNQTQPNAGNNKAVQTGMVEKVKEDKPVISASSAFESKPAEVPVGPTERAEFLQSQYTKVLKQIRRQLEYGIAKGGIVIKPYIVMYDDAPKESAVEREQAPVVEMKDKQGTDVDIENKKPIAGEKSTLRYNKKLPKADIEFDFVQADRFFPLTFDANGRVVEAAFIQTKVDKAIDRVFLRLEYHKLEGHTVIVENHAYCSTDMNLANSNNLRSASHLGTEIPLKDVPEWASYKERVVIEDVDRLLFAYFKMPEANTVDPYSPLGVSGYSRVVQLIKDADMQYSRLLWEFEGGEMAIDVDPEAMKMAESINSTEGHSMLPEKQQRLFRKVDLNAEDTYNVFAPALRDQSLINGLNTILMRIEDCTGISRGTLSEVNSIEAKTATELKILKQRSYATNADIQSALQDALEDTVYIMDVLCTLYNVTPDGEYNVSFEWDDSIIVDNESELSKRLSLMQNGLASRLENRMWYFGETENQARLALQQIDEEARESQRQKAEVDALSQSLLGNDKPLADTTGKKISQGKQADSLDNPDKSQTADQVKNKDNSK